MGRRGSDRIDVETSMSDHDKDSLDEIEPHLSQSDDPILVILRGHLLIETRLRDILVRVSRSPDELQDARLSFYQLLAVVRAIIGREDDAVWPFIKRLNEVRNRVAHHLEPGDLDEIIGSLVERLWARGVGPAMRLARLRVALHYACGYLDALKGAVGLRQAYVPRRDAG